MWVDEEAKVFRINLFGFYSIEDAEQFFIDYQRHTASLNKAEYNIVIDCIHLSTFQPDVLPYLEEAYRAYADFKGVHFINPLTPVGQIQLKRIAREVNLLEQFHFVKSFDDLQLI
ncbi:hypothetical protein [Gorillibacterium massiliense]|uniref:hypothetical protein n=1 Tax=Gorillibacterium massiliense TaxID=1280390 RepID=UPI0004AE09A3|nr:hypothetical protein [Gorillibacterium massiliense]